MAFLVRSARREDVSSLVDLTKQFSLLNLPADKRIISEKIEKSEASFRGDLEKSEAEYLFVLEDREEDLVVGSSLIMAKHGTEKVPHSYFKVFKVNHFSEDLGFGFIHQVLKFHLDYDGPSEIGGLLVDKLYRRRPEKLGRQISLSRFNFIGMNRDRFEDRILCELTPPLTEDGRSEFWEALGRRFTGLPYQEADLLSQTHKEFIESLFPQENIYLCLLDAKARAVLGRVGDSTRPAQHLLESIGFKYIDEVDPFDGGPHFACRTEEIEPIKQGRFVKCQWHGNASFRSTGIIGLMDGGEFRSMVTHYDIQNNNSICVPQNIIKEMRLEEGQELYLTPFSTKKGG